MWIKHFCLFSIFLHILYMKVMGEERDKWNLLFLEGSNFKIQYAIR